MRVNIDMLMFMAFEIYAKHPLPMPLAQEVDLRCAIFLLDKLRDDDYLARPAKVIHNFLVEIKTHQYKDLAKLLNEIVNLVHPDYQNDDELGRSLHNCLDLMSLDDYKLLFRCQTFYFYCILDQKIEQYISLAKQTFKAPCQSPFLTERLNQVFYACDFVLQQGILPLSVFFKELPQVLQSIVQSYIDETTISPDS